jgi:hypothetical protein
MIRNIVHSLEASPENSGRRQYPPATVPAKPLGLLPTLT